MSRNPGIAFWRPGTAPTQMCFDPSLGRDTCTRFVYRSNFDPNPNDLGNAGHFWGKFNRFGRRWPLLARNRPSLVNFRDPWGEPKHVRTDSVDSGAASTTSGRHCMGRNAPRSCVKSLLHADLPGANLRLECQTYSAIAPGTGRGRSWRFWGQCWPSTWIKVAPSDSTLIVSIRPEFGRFGPNLDNIGSKPEEARQTSTEANFRMLHIVVNMWQHFAPQQRQGTRV